MTLKHGDLQDKLLQLLHHILADVVHNAGDLIVAEEAAQNSA